MIELRFFVEQYREEYHEDGRIKRIKGKKRLQYRQMSNIEEIGIHPPIWYDWEDVPTEYE